MKYRMQKRGEEGVVLIITLCFLIAMALIVGYTAARSITHSTHLSKSVDNDGAYLALDGAQTALENQSSGVNEVYIGLPGTGDNVFTPGEYRFVDTSSGSPVLNLPTPDEADALAANIDWQEFGNISTDAETAWVGMALPGDIDGNDNDGDGTVDEVDGSEAGFISYYMASRVLHEGELVSFRAAEDVNSPGENVNVWQNAIFANIGQGGALINGNVSIHGSVHLLGNDPNAVVVTALDMSGTSFIHNSYGPVGNGGIPADLAARIGYTGVPGTSAAGFSWTDDAGDGSADQFTLDAKLRIKNGTVDLGGNSEVGEDGTSSTEKLTMDGVYIADGGGDEVLSGSDKIYSDNGFDQQYDLGSAVEFPTYDDDRGEVFVTDKYLDGFDAATWTAPDGVVHTNPTVGTKRVFNGNITLTAGAGAKKTPNSNNFYFNANVASVASMPNAGVVGVAAGTGNMPTEAQLAAKIAAGENFVWYNGNTTPPTLVVNGRLPVNGNVALNSGTGQDNTYEYKGKGTIMAFDQNGPLVGGVVGNMGVDAHLKTTSFPTTNLLGLMSQGNFAVGNSSQKDIMGGFYAQGTISLNYQSNIMGTIVGNYFDMGGQVPNIYQVQSLAENWTDDMRMIGSDPITSPIKVGWREYNVRLEAGS